MNKNDDSGNTTDDWKKHVKKNIWKTTDER